MRFCTKQKLKRVKQRRKRVAGGAGGGATGGTVEEGCVSRPAKVTPLQVVGATGGGGGPATRSLGNGGDLLAAAYGLHQLGVHIDPGLVWYLPAGAATEASFYTLLSHAGLSSPTDEAGFDPSARSHWMHLTEASDRLREEQRGQVSRAC